jgi:hypothetical protein
MEISMRPISLLSRGGGNHSAAEYVWAKKALTGEMPRSKDLQLALSYSLKLVWGEMSRDQVEELVAFLKVVYFTVCAQVLNYR